MKLKQLIKEEFEKLNAFKKQTNDFVKGLQKKYSKWDVKNGGFFDSYSNIVAYIILKHPTEDGFFRTIQITYSFMPYDKGNKFKIQLFVPDSGYRFYNNKLPTLNVVLKDTESMLNDIKVKNK